MVVRLEWTTASLRGLIPQLLGCTWGDPPGMTGGVHHPGVAAVIGIGIEEVGVEMTLEGGGHPVPIGEEVGVTVQGGESAIKRNQKKIM